MAYRTCVGRGVPLSKDVISREHILPQWLSKEVDLPNVRFKQYRHDEERPEDELLRSHDLGSLAIKNVCAPCNNGWMSRLENRAQPTLLALMDMQSSLLELSTDERRPVSAWAIKTAFMIAGAQQSVAGLPWHLFRGLAEEPEKIPVECFVLATQLTSLPKGFLYACPTDVLPPQELPVHVRVGYSIHHLHFVVVIPLLEAARVVRTSGVHLPIWPLEAEIRVRFENFPRFTSPNDLINFLTGLVRAGIVHN